MKVKGKRAASLQFSVSLLTAVSCGDNGTRASATAGLSSTSTDSAKPTTGDENPHPTSTGTDAGSGTSTMTSATTGSGPSCEDEPPPGFQVQPDQACQSKPQTGTFTPQVEWHKDMWTKIPGSKTSRSTPIVVQLADDNLDGIIDASDTPAVAYITYNPTNGADFVLRAVSGDGSNEILSIPIENGAHDGSQLAVGDLDDDQIVELVTVDNTGAVLAFEHTGELKWKSVSLKSDDNPDTEEPVGHHANAPAISDMDHDGAPEIVVGRVILSNLGEVLAIGDHGIGSDSLYKAAISFAVDLDGDDVQEVVVGNAVYDLDGTAIWFNNRMDGFPAVADLDLDGVPEIAVAGDGELRVQSSVDGGVLWSISLPIHEGGPPTLADFDGDGFPEIGIAIRNAYRVYEGDGKLLWENDQTIDKSSGITGSSVYDFEGDGIADVVYADEEYLWVFSGHDGSVKLKFPDHNSGTGHEYPVVADVDGDGEVEIVYCSELHDDDETYQGITVIGDKNHSWRPGRKIWNQHAYHITNIDDNGAVPKIAPKNWKSFNNFRSGDLSLNNGTAAPDLKLLSPEACANACTGGSIFTIWVQLGNVGAASLTAGALIEIYKTKEGVESLDLNETTEFNEILMPGEFAPGFTLDLNTDGVELLRIVAKSKEMECNVDEGNELVFMPPFCIPPR